MANLAATVAARLKAAGIRPGDPALAAVRAWNAGAAASAVVHVEERRGQFGKTRRATLRELYGDSCGWPSCPQHGPSHQKREAGE